MLGDIAWERIWFYLTLTAGAVLGLWKTLPPFLTWLETRKKNKHEVLRLDRSETAELKKIELQHEIDLKKLTDEQIWKLLEAKDKQIAHLEDVVEQLKSDIEEFEEADKQRGKLYMKKLGLLRLHRNRLQDIQLAVLNEGDKEWISNNLLLAVNDVDEYVDKLLG